MSVTETATVGVTPVELGLPSRFKSYRPDQFETANAAACSPRRVTFVDAPTGAGKSLINFTAAKLMGARALYLVGTKGLQTQVIEEAACIGARDIRGRSNYVCPLYSNCAEPTARDEKCPHSEGSTCSYKRAVDDASRSLIVVANYAYWMSIAKYGDGTSLGQFDLMIMDEAHTAPDWLTSACTIVLNRQDIQHLLGMTVPKVDDPGDVWIAWAQRAAVEATARGLQTPATDGRTRAKYKRLAKELADVAKTGDEDSGDWALEESDRGASVSIIPVWPQQYAEELLFRNIPKVIGSSATLFPQLQRYLGVPDTECDYLEVSNRFPVDRRPIIYIPTARIDFRTHEGDITRWVRRMDRIIEGRLDRKGIIHARSYSRALEIIRRSEFRDLMMTHDSRSTRDVVRQFKESDAPRILVSPSIEEGYDFPGSQCRYQIIAKVPFNDGRSPLMKARMADDKGYSDYLTALTMVQMAGRGMRSADDWCETFIVDDHWAWFRNKIKWRKWFRDAWWQTDDIPPAPNFD